MNDKPTVAEVVTKLQAQGSADQIALFLESEQITGWPGFGGTCAIAEYVKRATGLPHAVVGGGTVQVCSSHRKTQHDGYTVLEPINPEQASYDFASAVGAFIRSIRLSHLPETAEEGGGLLFGDIDIVVSQPLGVKLPVFQRYIIHNHTSQPRRKP